MQISNFEGQKFLNSSLADQDFKNLFNKPGPYYNCYPILGQWKNYKEIKTDYKESIIDFFKKNPRMSMMVSMYDKQNLNKKNRDSEIVTTFMNSLF